MKLIKNITNNPTIKIKVEFCNINAGGSINTDIINKSIINDLNLFILLDFCFCYVNLIFL